MTLRECLFSTFSNKPRATNMKAGGIKNNSVLFQGQGFLMRDQHEEEGGGILKIVIVL